MDRIVRRSTSDRGLTVVQEKISHLLFADDLAFLAESQAELQLMLSRFETECGQACMRISTSKTEAMVVSRAPSQCTLHVSGVPLKQVERFKYLGFTFTSDGKTDTEIDSRIGKSSSILRELYRTIIAKKELSNSAKLAVFRSVYVPSLTYGHEF